MTITTDKPEAEPTTAGDYLAALRDFAMAKGINAQTLLHDSHIPLQQLLSPPARINAIHMNRVASNFYKELKNPIATAVEFGLSISVSHHGLLAIAAQSAENVRGICNIVAQYFCTRTSTQEVSLTDGANYVHARLISKKLPGFDAQARYFFDLSTLVTIINCGNQVFDKFEADTDTEEMPIIRVDHSEPENFPHHLLQDLAIVEFDAEQMELCIPNSWMDFPLPTANTELTSAAIDQCESELRQLKPVDLIDQIRNRLRNISGNTPTLEQLASQLFMSPSTLKRRLKEQNTTYQEIKAEERFLKAQEMLQQGFQSESIAEQLGFSDASNFTKAFKKWSGMTPRAFRQSMSD